MSAGPQRGPGKSVLGVVLVVVAVGATAALFITARGRTRARPPAPGSTPVTDALTPALVAHCAAFPGDVVATPAAAMFQSAVSRTTLLDARSFAARTQPTLALVTSLLYSGPSRVEQTIDLWLARDGAVEDASIEDGGPRPEEVEAAMQKLRQPSRATLDVAPGRHAQIGSLGLGLGGAMIWATLSSPDGRYDLTVVVTAYASDYPFTQTEQAATRSLTQPPALTGLLTCLDAALWPRRGS